MPSLSKQCKAIQRLTVAGAQDQVTKRRRNHGAGSFRGVLGDRDLARPLASRFQVQMHACLTHRPAPRRHHQIARRLGMIHPGVILHDQGPGPERMVDASADRGPAGVDLAHTRDAPTTHTGYDQPSASTAHTASTGAFTTRATVGPGSPLPG